MQKKNKNFKLCSRFKALRESKSSIERDYTQDMLAKALKISKTQISNLENGKKFPSYTELQQYSKFFNIPADYLINEKASIKNENFKLGTDLGLTDKTIKLISDIVKVSEMYNPNSKNIPIKILNEMLTYKNGAFVVLLAKIVEYLEYNTYDTSKYFNIIGIEENEIKYYEENPYNGDKEAEFMLFRIQHDFINMLKDIKEQHIPKRSNENGKHSTKKKQRR